MHVVLALLSSPLVDTPPPHPWDLGVLNCTLVHRNAVGECFVTGASWSLSQALLVDCAKFSNPFWVETLVVLFSKGQETYKTILICMHALERVFQSSRTIPFHSICMILDASMFMSTYSQNVCR